MKKKILSICILAVGLSCIVVSIHAEIRKDLDTGAIFERAKINYVMANPNSYLYLNFYYDLDGSFSNFCSKKLLPEKYFPEGISTKEKIFIEVIDNRDALCMYKRGGQPFARKLQNHVRTIYSYISNLTTDMSDDLVVAFYTTCFRIRKPEPILIAFFAREPISFVIQ